MPDTDAAAADKAIRSYRSEAEAALAAGHLEGHGIAARVSRASRYRALSGGGYALRVPAQMRARALKILGPESGGVDMDEYADPDDPSYRRCPACGSVNVTALPLSPGQQRRALFTFGLALLLMPRAYECAKCGNAWRR